MKKYLLFLLFLTSFSGFSQKISQGTHFIGADINAGFQQTKIENSSIKNTLSVGFSPSFTKFKRANFSVTNLIGYHIERQSDTPFSTNVRFPNYTKYHTFTLGKYFKNYKMLTEKLGIAAQYGGSFNIILINYRYKSAFLSLSEQKSSIGQGIGLNIGAGANIIYLLNEKIAFEGSATLLNLNINYNKTGNLSNFSASTGLNGSPFLGLGVRYFCKKKAS